MGWPWLVAPSAPRSLDRYLCWRQRIDPSSTTTVQRTLAKQSASWCMLASMSVTAIQEKQAMRSTAPQDHAQRMPASVAIRTSIVQMVEPCFRICATPAHAKICVVVEVTKGFCVPGSCEANAEYRTACENPANHHSPGPWKVRWCIVHDRKCRVSTLSS